MKSWLLLFALFYIACSTEPAANNSLVSSTSKDLPQGTKVVQKDTVKPKDNIIIIENPRPKAEIKQQFPYDIELKTAAGELHNSANILAAEGQPTVLLFWLTTCYPCRMEMAAIEKEFANWQSTTNFKMVAISTDFQKYYPAFVKRVNESNWPWETYNDHKREFRYVMPGSLNGLPQVFVLDANGQITYHKRRYESGDEHKLYEAIKKAAG